MTASAQRVEAEDLIQWGAVSDPELHVEVVSTLYLEQVVLWFLLLDEGAVQGGLPFTLQRALATGGYEVVQGIYHRETKRVTVARKLRVDRMDSELSRVHGDKALAVYG